MTPPLDTDSVDATASQAPRATPPGSLRPADPRFVLPAPVRSVRVLGPLEGWRAACERLGLLAPAGSPADLVVTPPAMVAEAVIEAPPVVVVTGGRARALARAGYAVERMLVRPGPQGPRLVVPIRHRRALRFALLHHGPVRGRWRRLLNLLLLHVLRGFSLRRAVLVVAARRPGLPFPVAAARPLGVPEDAEWVLELDPGSDTTVGVFLVFAAEDAAPRWAIKFDRVPGPSRRLGRERRGLERANAGRPFGGVRAPRVLGEARSGGTPISVQSAVTGRRCDVVLNALRSRARKLALVDRVATALLELGRETAVPPAELVRERRRLADEVLPALVPGRATDLVRELPPVPGVLAHNDCGASNVFVGPDGLALIDWEFCRRPGLPLGDVVQFLAGVLVPLSGDGDADERTALTLALFRGELDASPVLFRWVRDAVAALELPVAAPGPLAALRFLELEHIDRSERALLKGRAHRPTEPLWRIGRAWLQDPALGPGWDAWRAARWPQRSSG